MSAKFTDTQTRLVLAMERPLLEDGFYSWTNFVEANKDRALGMITRKFLEQSKAWMHFIPYVVFTKTNEKGETLYFTYRRSAKVGEERLIGKYSVGVGGHCELNELRTDSNTGRLDAAATIIATCEQELSEELVICEDKSLVCVGLKEHESLAKIYDIGNYQVFLDKDYQDPNGSDVGEYHIGVTQVINVDGFNVWIREEELLNVGFLRQEELESIIDSGDMERWSELILTRLFRDGGL